MVRLPAVAAGNVGLVGWRDAVAVGFDNFQTRPGLSAFLGLEAQRKTDTFSAPGFQGDVPPHGAAARPVLVACNEDRLSAGHTRRDPNASSVLRTNRFGVLGRGEAWSATSRRCRALRPRAVPFRMANMAMPKQREGAWTTLS